MQYHDKRLLVLFFDFSNMGIPDQLRAQDSSLKFLDKQMTESDMVAILLFTTTVQVKTDFTADRTMLRTVIKNCPSASWRTWPTWPIPATMTARTPARPLSPTKPSSISSIPTASWRPSRTPSSKLAKLSEKKVLIYITGGISQTGIDNQAQLEASINAAVKANVAIYPHRCARPDGRPSRRGRIQGRRRAAHGIFTGSRVQLAARFGINNSQETLVYAGVRHRRQGVPRQQRSFARHRAGAAGVPQLLHLGYYTTNHAIDGKYRKITVKLNGDTTAKLEVRQGYYADKVWGKFTGAEKEKQLQEALASPDPKTDIPMALETDYFRISPTAYFVPVSVKIPGSRDRSGGEARRRRNRVRFHRQRDRRAQDAWWARCATIIKVKLDASEEERLARRNFHYDAGFTLGPGRYRIQFLVRENESGKMGTFDARFVVPDLAADSMPLKTSSVIWSNQREALKAAVGAAERTPRREAAANPLIIGDEKIVPNVTKCFRRGQNMYIAFDVYDAAPDPADCQQTPGGGEHEPVQPEGDESV